MNIVLLNQNTVLARRRNDEFLILSELIAFWTVEGLFTTYPRFLVRIECTTRTCVQQSQEAYTLANSV